MSSNDEISGTGIGLLTLATLCVVAAAVAVPMWGCPKYKVYEQSLQGQAVLAEAESSRQVAIQEAHAKLESAKLLAQAEVERAKGVAEANKIIGESLKGNDAYLRYLWIQSLENGTQPTIVYVPTEAGLPILEASRMRDVPKAEIEKP